MAGSAHDISAGLCALDRLARAKKPMPQIEFMLRSGSGDAASPHPSSGNPGAIPEDADAAEHAFSVGDTVTLTEDYSEYGEAMCEAGGVQARQWLRADPPPQVRATQSGRFGGGDQGELR